MDITEPGHRLFFSALRQEPLPQTREHRGRCKPSVCESMYLGSNFTSLRGVFSLTNILVSPLSRFSTGDFTSGVSDIIPFPKQTRQTIILPFAMQRYFQMDTTAL